MRHMRQDGFTMLEMVLAVGLLVIISTGFLGVSLIFYNYGEIVPEGRLGTEVFRLHQAALEEIRVVARQAQSIMATGTADGITYTSGTSTVVLRLFAVDASGNIIDNTYDSIIFYTTSSAPTQLYKQLVPNASSVRPSAKQMISANVDTFTISYNQALPASSTKMQIYFQTSKSSASTTRTVTSTIEVTLR